jgi:coproporphyrinogen III oxidase
MGMKTFRAEMEDHFRGLRDRIISGLQALEGPSATFRRTPWERPGGGGGEMSELRGDLFEKAGCNFSAVHGPSFPAAPPGAASAPHGDDVRPPAPEEIAGKPFFAAGVSLVLHPRNPFVPVVHMNVRYLEAGDVSWFGGGMDLTPFRPFPEDTAHFHGVLQQACGADRYARFSQWAREYFFIVHRNSERGVGGVFFDYLRGKEHRQLVQSVGDAFLPAYVPIVERRRDLPFTEADRAGQLRWRGRYVEFNLIYDRGTLFGLKSGGNVDAIFMSLPPLVSW